MDMGCSSCSPGNPNPNNKSMQAYHFLRALERISRMTPISSPMQRSGRIKRAAYSAMARAAGSRSAWSRAMLRSLRRRSRLRPQGGRGIPVAQRIRVSGTRPREISRADTLRSLVPGGKDMDFCNLLEETAEYIRCLSTQVSLMQSVANSMPNQ